MWRAKVEGKEDAKEKMWRTKEMLQREEQMGRWKKMEEERRWKKGEDSIGKWKKEDESHWRTHQEGDVDRDEEVESNVAANYAAGYGVLGVRRRSTFR